MEVTGYIFNRGNRDWAVKMSEFNQQWAKWRFETRKEIEKGETWWLEQDRGMREEMGRWSEEASKSGSKAAVEKMYQELEGRVSGYEKKMRGNIPGSGNFNIDTDAILKNALSSIPEMSIGVMNNSMSAVDTTAGLSNMLNLGLNGSLFIHNEKEMAAYEQAYSVMQNMRVLDILNAILDGFSEQLKGANESLYEAVYGFSKGEYLISAPFLRHESERVWTIKVCVESSALGKDKFKTRRFADYKDYKNSTVFLKPVKGLGQEIDFTKPSSYINIDKDELDVYVGLASEWLSREIDNVFKEKDGLFWQHQEEEFERLGDKFGKYYKEWKEGEILRGLGVYNKPIIGNGPSILVSMSIGAQVAGGLLGGPGGAALGAVIMGTVNTGIGVADGTMSWEHAGAQMGTGVITSGSGMFAPIVGGALQGIDYKEGGSIGWSKKGFKDGMKQGVKEFGVRALTFNLPVLSDVAASWVDAEGGWTDFGFDNDNWSDHIFAGVNSGLGSAGVGGQLIGEALRTATYNLIDGKGFSESGQGSFNWDQFKLTARDVGTNLISALDFIFNGEQEDSKSDTGDPFSKAETMLGGWWESIRREYEEGGLLAGAGAVAAGYAGLVMSGLVTGYEDAKQSWAFMGMIGGFGVIDSALSLAKEGWSWLKDAVGGLFGGEHNSDIQRTTDSAANTQAKISEIEAMIEKIAKSNPEEAEWLSEKVKMMQQGIIVNELDKSDRVDVSNAVKDGSVQYYLLNEFMRSGCIDMGRAGEFDEIMEKYNNFVEQNGREPNRFELLYDGDMSKLTDPSLWKQNGPMKDVFVNTLNDLIDKYQSGDMNLNGDSKKLMEYMLAEIDKRNFGDLVKDTAGGICRAFTLWTISVGQGAYNGGFDDFYMENFEKGYIGSMSTKDEFKTSFVNNPAAILKDYGLSYNTIKALTGDVDKNGNWTYNSMNDEMLAKIPTGVDKAIAWIDTKGTSGRGKHYINLERRGSDWIMMDHNGNKYRGSRLDRLRTYILYYSY